MTQRIQKNQSNNCIFSLAEKTTLDNAYYLLEVFSKQNHDSKVMRLSGDTSLNTIRYNEFTITESSSEDLDNGIISLGAGEYNYFVWQSSASTLSLSAATSIVESGLLTIVGTGTTEYSYTGTPSEYTVQY